MEFLSVFFLIALYILSQWKRRWSLGTAFDNIMQIKTTNLGGGAYMEVLYNLRKSHIISKKKNKHE